MLLHLVPGLCVSYGACEAHWEWGRGFQSLYVCLDDLIGHCLDMIVQ